VKCISFSGSVISWFASASPALAPTHAAAVLVGTGRVGLYVSGGAVDEIVGGNSRQQSSLTRGEGGARNLPTQVGRGWLVCGSRCPSNYNATWCLVVSSFSKFGTLWGLWNKQHCTYLSCCTCEPAVRRYTAQLLRRCLYAAASPHHSRMPCGASVAWFPSLHSSFAQPPLPSHPLRSLRSCYARQRAACRLGQDGTTSSEHAR